MSTLTSVHCEGTKCRKWHACQMKNISVGTKEISKNRHRTILQCGNFEQK